MRHAKNAAIAAACALSAALSLAVAVGCGGGGGGSSAGTVRTVRTPAWVRIEHALPGVGAGAPSPDPSSFMPRSARSVRLRLEPLSPGGRTAGAVSVPLEPRAVLEGEFPPGRYKLTVSLHAQDFGKGAAVASGEQFLEIGAAPDAPQTVPIPALRTTVRRVSFTMPTPRPILSQWPPPPSPSPTPLPPAPVPYVIPPSIRVDEIHWADSLRAIAYDAAGEEVELFDADWRWQSSDPAAVYVLEPASRQTRLYAPRGPAQADLTAIDIMSGARATVRVVVTATRPTPTPTPTPTPVPISTGTPFPTPTPGPF